MVKKLLVPLKFDAESIQVMKYATYFAKEKKAKITLLHVMPMCDAMDFPERLFSDEETKHNAEFRLSKMAKDIIHPNNIDYEIIISKGNEKEKVIEFATNFNINYLILGKTFYNVLLDSIENIFENITLPEVAMHNNDIHAFIL